MQQPPGHGIDQDADCLSSGNSWCYAVYVELRRVIRTWTRNPTAEAASMTSAL